jgi:hypothetical protein
MVPLSDGRNDEAKEFLQRFLDQLAQSDRTNQELVRMQSMTVEQNNQIILALGTLSAQLRTVSAQIGGVSAQLSGMSSQLDGVAQRSDYLYDQMGRLGQILVNDGYSLPPGAPSQSFQPESIARGLAGEVVNGVVKSFFPGRGGSGRSRGR